MAFAVAACGSVEEENGDVGASEDEVVWEPISMAPGLALRRKSAGLD